MDSKSWAAFWPTFPDDGAQDRRIGPAGAAAEFASLVTLFTAGILPRTYGPVLWYVRGRDLFAPALNRIGLHSDRVIYCETWKDRDVLPAMEEGLNCMGLAGVVGEITRLSLTEQAIRSLPGIRSAILS